MTAQVENVRTDTAYKKGLASWEPWKVVLTGIAAGAGGLTAAVAIMTLILHWAGKL